MARRSDTTNSKSAPSSSCVTGKAQVDEATTIASKASAAQLSLGGLRKELEDVRSQKLRRDDDLRKIFERAPLTAVELHQILEDVCSQKLRLEKEERRSHEEGALADRQKQDQDGLDRAVGRIAGAIGDSSSLNDMINVAIAAERKDGAIQGALLHAGRQVMELARSEAGLGELREAIQKLGALMLAGQATLGIAPETTRGDRARDESLREVAHRLDLIFERYDVWDRLQSAATARNAARQLEMIRSTAAKLAELLSHLQPPLSSDLEATFKIENLGLVSPFELAPILRELAKAAAAVRDGRNRDKRSAKVGQPSISRSKNWSSRDRLASDLEGLYQLCIDQNVEIKHGNEEGAFVEAKRGEKNGLFVKFVGDCCKAFGHKPPSVSTLQKMRPRRQSHFSKNK